VDAFCGENEAFDDMAILALVYKGDEGEWRSLSVELSAFDTVKETVIAAAGDKPETRQALLACDEALTNIVSYSGANILEFCCTTNGEGLSVTFSDNGIPFDPTAAILEEKDFEYLDGGGMGLNLIRQSTASLHYERRGDRNILTLFFSMPLS
jgi:anti-sigma regulatory factor (Ser/Thr protein kinase)